jgi:hypothetical protein
VQAYTIKKPEKTASVPNPELRKDFPVDTDRRYYRPLWTGPDAAFEEAYYFGITSSDPRIEVTVKLKPLTVTMTGGSFSGAEEG